MVHGSSTRILSLSKKKKSLIENNMNWIRQNITWSLRHLNRRSLLKGRSDEILVPLHGAIAFLTIQIKGGNYRLHESTSPASLSDPALSEGKSFCHLMTVSRLSEFDARGFYSPPSRLL